VVTTVDRNMVDMEVLVCCQTHLCVVMLDSKCFLGGYSTGNAGNFWSGDSEQGDASNGGRGGNGGRT